VDITSVEVIRHPGVAIEVVTGEEIELTYGDTLKVNVGFDFRGSGQSVSLYGAIGKRRAWVAGGFDEILVGEADIKLPDSRTVFTPCERSVNIPIVSAIDPGTDYDLYVKIKEYPEAGMPEVDDVVDIIGIPPTYELIHVTIYHFAYIYDGDVEITTATYRTDPFTPSVWNGKRVASKLEEEVKARGGHPLEVRVYADISPLLWTDFQIEVVSTPIGSVTEAGIAAIPLWAAILISCLAIIGVVVAITLAFKTIMGEFKHKPGLKDVKPAWGKEALIVDIQDAEEYWERPLTPAETLEGMSEEELRDYLDQIAEEEAPSEVPWWPIAIGAGVVVLGVGVALATRKRSE